MALQRNNVGDRAYVWTTRAGQASPGTTEAVISAHGLDTIVNGHFSKAWDARLLYYGPHGYFLTDPGLDDVLNKRLDIIEVQRTSTNCQDYVLSKFQGDHGGGAGDSYGAIANKKNRYVEANNKYLRADDADARGNAGMAAFFRQQAGMMFSGNPAMDVITVRNRWNSKLIMLSTLLELVHAAGYNYTAFHCSFCRGGISDLLSEKLLGNNRTAVAQRR